VNTNKPNFSAYSFPGIETEVVGNKTPILSKADALLQKDSAFFGME
jgi:hypothetical protein